MGEAIYNLYNYMELGSKTFKELLYTHTRRFNHREDGQSPSEATTEVKAGMLSYRTRCKTTLLGKCRPKTNSKYCFTPIRLATLQFGNARKLAKMWKRNFHVWLVAVSTEFQKLIQKKITSMLYKVFQKKREGTCPRLPFMKLAQKQQQNQTGTLFKNK